MTTDYHLFLWQLIHKEHKFTIRDMDFKVLYTCTENLGKKILFKKMIRHLFGYHFIVTVDG